MKRGTRAVLGGTAATGAALAAAYYFYASERADEHRRTAKRWARNAEQEIVQAARRVRNKALSDRNIRALIAEAAHRYRMTKDLDPQEVRDFVAGMQERWHAVRDALSDEEKKGKKTGTPARGRQSRPRATRKKKVREGSS